MLRSPFAAAAAAAYAVTEFEGLEKEEEKEEKEEKNGLLIILPGKLVFSFKHILANQTPGGRQARQAGIFQTRSFSLDCKSHHTHKRDIRIL